MMARELQGSGLRQDRAAPLREDPEKLVDALMFRFFQGPVPDEGAERFRSLREDEEGSDFHRPGGGGAVPPDDEHAVLPADLTRTPRSRRLPRTPWHRARRRLRENLRFPTRSEPMNDFLKTRRDFLRTGLLGASATWTVPAFVGRTFAEMDRATRDLAVQAATGKDGPILVVVQLAGGNDGLNTVVPFGDDAYHKARPRLAKKAKELNKLDDYVGLNSAMPFLNSLYRGGRPGGRAGGRLPEPEPLALHLDLDLGDRGPAATARTPAGSGATSTMPARDATRRSGFRSTRRSRRASAPRRTRASA